MHMYPLSHMHTQHKTCTYVPMCTQHQSNMNLPHCTSDMLQVLYHLLVACVPCMYLVYLQCLRPSTSLCNRHYMVLTLDLFRMESSFTTASCQRGEPLLLHVRTLQCTPISHHCWCVPLSAAHLVQVGSTATGVQLSFSAELVEQTAARAQW